jgi:hypothetical protein
MPYEWETPQIPELTHVLVGEPDATSPGHALVSLERNGRRGVRGRLTVSPVSGEHAQFAEAATQGKPNLQIR